MRSPVEPRSTYGAISFHSQPAFWAGAAAVTAGVILHMPMYLNASDMHYRLEGMAVTGGMYAGMALMPSVMVAMLTVYGFRVSLAGRKLIGEF